MSQRAQASRFCRPVLFIGSDVLSSTAADARVDGIERSARRNEQGLPIFSAEYQLQRTLGDLDGVDRFAGGVVDIDLPGGDVDVATLIDSDAFAALVGEEFFVGQVAVRQKTLCQPGRRKCDCRDRKSTRL